MKEKIISEHHLDGTQLTFNENLIKEIHMNLPCNIIYEGDESMILNGLTRRDFEFELKNIFEEYPIHTGDIDYDYNIHPAEKFISDSIKDNNNILNWIKELLLSHDKDLSENVIFIIGRIDNIENDDWKLDIVESALESDSHFVRYSAYLTADLWLDVDGMEDVLYKHIESEEEQYIKDSIKNIIEYRV